jgi:hypothetical protein
MFRERDGVQERPAPSEKGIAVRHGRDANSQSPSGLRLLLPDGSDVAFDSELHGHG